MRVVLLFIFAPCCFSLRKDEKLLVLSVVDPTVCLNGGTMQLNNITCDCLPFAFGNNCENLSCQNGGVGGSNQGTCTCPPGFEGRFCETRGCRPPIEGNRLSTKRSFVILILDAQSMAQTRQDLADNVISTVNGLEANEGYPYFDEFICVAFAGRQGSAGGGMSFGKTESLANFPTIIKQVNARPNPPDQDYQPVISSLYGLLNSYLLHPDSTILVFTDRMEKDPYQEDFLPSSRQSPYLAVANIALHWKSKTFFYLIQDGPIPMDPTSPRYDAFRQVATFTHGEVFPIKRADVPNVMKKEFPYFYKPQNIGVRKHAKCFDIILNIPRDSSDQIVYFLITADQNPEVPGPFIDQFYVVPTVQDVIMTPTFQNDYYALFTLLPNETLPFPHLNETINQVRVGISLNNDNLTCSVTVFVPSDLTALFTYVDVNTIDGGNVFNFIEGVNSMTGTAFGFKVDPSNFATYIPIDLVSGASQSEENSYLSSARSPSCSFELSIPTPPTCVLGPYGQFFQLPVSRTTTITRILPGLCVHHAYESYSIQPTAQPTLTAQPNSCYQMNSADLQEPRLGEFKQVVFAVEMTAEMNASVTYLAQILRDTVMGISSSTKLEKQYTLVTFDTYGWTARLDEFNPEIFSTRAVDLLTSLIKAAPSTKNWQNGVHSPDAVYGAYQLKIKPPQIIHVFTLAASGASNVGYLLTPDTQVNIYQINDDATINVTFALTNQALQMQSNGRLMDITSNSIQTMSQLLVDATYENNLVFSGALEDCSADLNNFYFNVEPAATSLSILAVGKSVGLDSKAIWIGDGGGVLITLSDKDQRIKTMNSVAIKLDLAALQSNQKGWPGNWTVIISNITGPCFLQARVESKLNMAIGFVSDQASDFPNKMPYARLAQDGAGNFSVVARVVSTPVILDTVILENIPTSWPWATEMYKNLSTSGVFKLRDQKMCAYQFISSLLTLPMQWSLRATIYGRQTVDKTEYLFQRMFYYSNNPLYELCSPHTKAQVHLITGQCNCDVGYTGEYCENPICDNRGYSSYGICDCPDGYTGVFCQQTFFNGSTSPSTNTPILPTTHRSGSSTTHNTSFAYLTVLFSLLTGYFL